VSAFPAHAETEPTFKELGFYTNDAQALTNLVSANVALIAVIVSVVIASKASRTAKAANETASKPSRRPRTIPRPYFGASAPTSQVEADGVPRVSARPISPSPARSSWST